jgi:hypothetical protein
MAEAWIQIHDSAHGICGGHLQPQYEGTFAHQTVILLLLLLLLLIR